MKRSIALASITIAAMALIVPAGLVAQVANENLANGIIAARKKNAALMAQYTWNSRTELFENGSVKGNRLETVNVGPDGGLQRNLINDQGAPLPRGFLRHMIAENKKKQTEEYLSGLRALLKDYTLPTAGKLIDFISQANVKSVTAPDGKAELQVSGNNVVLPGDTYSMSVDATTKLPRRVQITTFYKEKTANVTVTYRNTPAGLAYPAFSEVELPDSNMSLQVHNFDYVQND